MQVESVLCHTAKFDKPDFGEAPEAFDAVDMVGADSEFILCIQSYELKLRFVGVEIALRTEFFDKLRKGMLASIPIDLE